MFFFILTPDSYAAFELLVVTAITSCRIIMFTGHEITTARKLDWNKERLSSIITLYHSANIFLTISETNLPDDRSLLKNDISVPRLCGSPLALYRNCKSFTYQWVVQPPTHRFVLEKLGFFDSIPFKSVETRD